MKKRVLSIIAAIIMVTSILPAPALAWSPDPTSAGLTIYDGRYSTNANTGNFLPDSFTYAGQPGSNYLNATLTIPSDAAYICFRW